MRKWILASIALTAVACSGPVDDLIAKKSPDESNAVNSAVALANSLPNADSIIANVRGLSSACEGEGDFSRAEAQRACGGLARIVAEFNTPVEKEPVAPHEDVSVAALRESLQDAVYLCAGNLSGAGAGITADEACVITGKAKAELRSLLAEMDRGQIIVK